MMVSNFLFELGCEELPSRAVLPLAKEFSEQMIAALDKAGLKHGEIHYFATPRRIALLIYDLAVQQPSQLITRKGPAISASYDKEGNASPALLGFAKSCGVDVGQLTRIQTEKGEWMAYELHAEANKTIDLLPVMVRQSLSALTIVKPMRWGANEFEFIRPVHWAVMLYGDELIAAEFFGIKTTRESRGHRFHHPQSILLNKVEEYALLMEDAYVIADFNRRRQMIREQVEQLARANEAIAIIPEDLLDEVTSIVEWPKALVVNFAPEFLTVPAEALIAAMQSHQKCFALKDKKGQLIAKCVTVANIASSNPQQVILGNEKVMRARLSDAAFFFNQDKKLALKDLLPATQQVIFQVKLGSLYDKAQRLSQLMQYLSPFFAVSVEQAGRAALLSKCDLLTGMVAEFPELQGLMGYYYALENGEDAAVAKALDEQYMPRFSLDALPDTTLGSALSLADRIDTLVGIFSIGLKPSGVKDPFKLRRHALAVVRLLIQIQGLKLSDLIHQSITIYNQVISIDKQLITELKSFILDRLQSHYLNQGVSIAVINAVRARQEDCFYDIDKRIIALLSFEKMDEAEALSAACKRVNNLLSHEANEELSSSLDESLLSVEAEKVLYARMKQLASTLQPLYQKGDYSVALQQLASLKEPIDAFFEKTMVMVDDLMLRKNRLALLTELQALLQEVADISILSL